MGIGLAMPSLAPPRCERSKDPSIGDSSAAGNRSERYVDRGRNCTSARPIRSTWAKVFVCPSFGPRWTPIGFITGMTVGPGRVPTECWRRRIEVRFPRRQSLDFSSVTLTHDNLADIATDCPCMKQAESW